MISQLYDSFNARNYTPSQVAKTFVPSEEFESLWRNEHTVLLGPRGSGKTTLFKMLTVQALYNWSHPMAIRLKTSKPFTAIFIPSDMHWHHQLLHAEEHLQAAPRFSLSASQAAVTTSVLLAVARTFQERLEFEIQRNEDLEASLCKQLINQWKLPKTVSCLDMVVLTLKARIADIRRIVNEAIFKRVSDTDHFSVPDYFHLDYFSELDFACSAFDLNFSCPPDSKWAICFDELELAPPWLQDRAFSEQRSSDERYLIKLSTSPIPKTLGSTESRPKQDIRLICLWNHVRRRGEDFDEELAKSYLKRRFGENVTPVSLLGPSEIAVENDEDSEKYSRGSAEWKLFKSIASWDRSFREILLTNRVNPDDPFTDDPLVRDSILRKAKPVAILRSAFMKASSAGKYSLRSRKLSSIYYGREAVYRISDGNPRRLIGILGDLCANIPEGQAHQQLNTNDQANVLTRASYHFEGYIRALPGGSVALGGNSIDLSTLLRSIGDFFRRRMLGEDFPLDPPGSFQVDSNMDERVVELLRLGVYHGALVYVDPVPDTMETSLRKKRFRLSYMLSPRHKLQLTLNDSISLNTILRSSFRVRVKRVLPSIIGQREFELRLGGDHETG